MKSLEEDVVKAMNKALLERAEVLSNLGIAWEPPTIEVWRSEEQDYTSEARIDISKNGQLHDVLEFHVYRNGRPVVTVKDVDEWLAEQIAGLGYEVAIADPIPTAFSDQSPIEGRLYCGPAARSTAATLSTENRSARSMGLAK